MIVAPETDRFINKKPIRELEHLVHSFYFQSFNGNTPDNSGLIADDGCYEIMLVKEKNAILKTGNNTKYQIPRTYTIHKVDQPFGIEYASSFNTFCIKLQPWVNALFFSDDLPQGVIDLRMVFGEEISCLHDRVFSVSDFGEMVEIAEEFIIRQNFRIPPETKFIRKVCDEIYERNGNVTVEELADLFKTTRQALNKLFYSNVKHTLKRFILLIRMRAAIEYKLANPDIPLTSIAYMFGYSDQSHFVNNFKRLCGTTPSDFVKNKSYSCNDLR
nr:AraC family transcriptional regulator [Allomuricauda sp.]